VKLKGDFVWHDHDDTDETFIILDGALRIDFRDGHVNLTAGEMLRRAERRRTQAVCGK
jgi:mannose-6-phosphate isomerase-like protein (cupin superfamily)